MFKPRAPRSPSEAWTFACLNQLATPGFGSILGKRYLAGGIQLAMAVGGFCGLGWWFIQKMRLLYGQISGTNLPLDAGNTAGKVGLVLFAAAWLFALVTSIQLVRSVKSLPPTLIPPKIQ